MKISVCLIVFGYLGKSAKLSLDSISRIQPSRICIIADSQGKKWIGDFGTEDVVKNICWHIAKSDVARLIDLKLDESQGYSEYGKSRFIKLTVYKWTILRECLSLHPETEFALFTDLDVLWNQDPRLEIERSLKSSNSLVAIQDDTPVGAGARHYCTGVMAWKNNSKSIEVLRELEQSQKQLLESGIEIPDEPTFNKWMKTHNPTIAQTLNPRLVVIGHRYFHLLLNKRFRTRELICFHANYVVGERTKYRRLQSLKWQIQRNPRWFQIYILELIKYLLSGKKIRL